MSPRLPIHRQRVMVDAQGRVCKVDVIIEQTADTAMYPPDGKKCVFRIVREKVAGDEDFELVLLIDNHEPFGYHHHDKLPEIHGSREPIHTSSWEEAWKIFDEKMKELLK